MGKLELHTECCDETCWKAVSWKELDIEWGVSESSSRSHPLAGRLWC